MEHTVRSAAAARAKRQARLRHAAPMIAMLAGFALAGAGCGGSAAGSAASRPSSNVSVGAVGGGGGAGPVLKPGSSAGAGSGQRSTGSYTVAFARCMRAHGVPGFPDPHGQASQLASSGIDPTSARFQSALNGPCESLAPRGWVSSGPVSQ
jgi:hypothetical protein